MEYRVDPSRSTLPETGIFIRAKNEDGRWGAHDLAHLDRDSVLAWLRSRGEVSTWAEDTVGQLLGHGLLNDPDAGPVKIAEGAV